jgi:hypothetical protein
MTLRVTTHNAMIFSLTTLSIMAKRIAPLILSRIYFTVLQSVIMLNVILLNVAEPSKGARYCFMDAQRSIKFKFESVEVHQPFLNELLYAFIVPLWLMSGFVWIILTQRFIYMNNLQFNFSLRFAFYTQPSICNRGPLYETVQYEMKILNSNKYFFYFLRF